MHAAGREKDLLERNKENMQKHTEASSPGGQGGAKVIREKTKTSQ